MAPWPWGRLLVGTCALLEFIFGAWFLIDPDALVSDRLLIAHVTMIMIVSDNAIPPPQTPLGIELKGADARVDIRATYGGLELGVAAFLAFCVHRHEEFLLAGVVASGFTAAGFGAGRLIGIIAEDFRDVDVQMWLFLLLELILAGAALHRYWTMRREAGAYTRAATAGPPATGVVST